MTTVAPCAALMAMILGLAAGCGKPPVVDPAFRGYYAEFRSLMRSDCPALRSGRDVSIVFGDPGGLVLGSCDEDAGTIMIAESAWGSLNEDQRRGVIFHELGHCVLMRGHTTETTTRVATEGAARGAVVTVAASIMNPDSNAAALYFSWGLEAEYEHELFAGASVCAQGSVVDTLVITKD